jgi:hypothetical protein
VNLKIALALAAICWLALVAHAWAGCDYPMPPPANAIYVFTPVRFSTSQAMWKRFNSAIYNSYKECMASLPTPDPNEVRCVSLTGELPSN